MKMYLKITILTQFLLISHTFSQSNIYHFKHLTVQEGLSRSYVKCMLTDSLGYIWLGTDEGLNRYDGISFKTYKYKSNDNKCLNNNNIQIVFEDKRKNLWVGTQTGINLYDRNRDEFIPIKSINNYVNSIYEYSDGNFLIGSPGGLFLFNPKDYSGKQIRYDIHLEDFLHDSNNNFWLASYSGLLLLDTSDYSYSTIIPLTSNKRVQSLFQDSKGGIWVGTNSDGLIYMTYEKNNPQNPTFLSFKSDPRDPESISEGAVLAINEDENGYLWIGIENGGVNLLDLKTIHNKNVSFQHITYNPYDSKGLSDNSIHCIYRDKQNTMWIGTYGNGVNFYNAYLQKFNHFKHLPGTNTTINNNRVNTIYEEEKFIWIGTESGLNVYDKSKGTFQYYTYDYKNPNSIGSNAVWSICRDSRNNMWIGTWNGGLNLFDERTKTFKRFLLSDNNPNTPGSNNMLDILESKDKILWIATMNGGLNTYNPQTNTFERFYVDYNRNSISGNWVNGVLESSDGNIWISTTVAVNILNRKTGYYSTFTHNPSDTTTISYNGATSFFEDSKKNIWIGTSNGLNLFIRKDSTFKKYFQVDGLPDNVIRAIEEDDDNNLWLSTNNGISKFVNAANLPEKPVFINYNVNDGLQGNEFNSRSSFKNKDGLIYFGGTNGYNVFDPKKIKSNPYVPNIVFTKLLIFNKPVGIGTENSPLTSDISCTKKLKLKRSHSVFTIEFSSLNLLAPENNQYAFILEGFEKNWNYVGKQHTATFTNLDPGKYTFRVKATNNDGLWNNEGISLEIVVLPAWWQTWLAKLVYLTIIIIAIYYFRKHSIYLMNLKNQLWREHLEKQKSEELNQLKSQFFTNISHELRTPLTLIIGPLQKLVSEEKNKELLEIIYRNATKLKTLVDQILDFSKIENHMMKLVFTRKDLVETIHLCIGNFTGFASQKNVDIFFKSSLRKCIADIDVDKLDKILTNIVSNAIKNTPEKGLVSISLELEKEKKSILIEISDTGRGITPDEITHIFDRFYSVHQAASNGTGIGLNLTQKLVELHNGKITVSSVPDESTVFSISLPLNIYETEYGQINECLTLQNANNENTNWNSLPEFRHEKTILIIDDNIEMCRFIETIISNEYNVIKENNPVECFNLITKYLPDLIISDVMMPELDGFDICRQLKNDVRFCHIPLILLTAKATTTDTITGFETGADDYIYKPFDGDILRARIKNLILQKEKLRQHFIGSDGIVNQKITNNKLDVVFVDQIVEIIKEQYPNPNFDVNIIIEKVGMSRSIFYKKFKSLSDVSINDLIKTIRLKKAAEFIKAGKLSISQVAFNCGFNDPAYFSKVFKDYYKVSPKEFANS